MAQVLKEEVKQNILESAKIAFMTDGYDQCTVRRIAKGAGITVGNLYNYFENKQAIYDDIVNSVINIIDEVLTTRTEGKVSFYQSISDDALVVNNENARVILEGIFLLLPSLLEKHRTDVLILLKYSEGLKDNKASFNLVRWVGDYMEVLYDGSGTGYYFATAMLKGIESIITHETEPEVAQKKLVYFIETFLQKEG